MNHRLPIILVLLLLGACGHDEARVANGDRAITLAVWLHAGNKQEQQTLQAQVVAFNARQYRIRVNAVILPDSDYNARIQDAADRHQLPDIIEVNSAQLARYAWQSYLRPLDKLLTDESHENLLPQALAANSYEGRLYALPTHLQMPLLYARRDLLATSGIKMPATAWSIDQFQRILQQLARHDNDGRVLVMAMGPGTTELLLPALRSAGGRLLEQQQELHLRGVLDSGKNIQTLSILAAWQQHGFLSIPSSTSTQDAFYNGNAALSWASMDMGRQYRQRWHEQLIALPLPDFGNGSRLSLSGWGWALTRDSRHAQAAMHFLEFILEDAQINAISNAAYSVPTSQRLLQNWQGSDEGPREEIKLLQQLPRNVFNRIPATPAYPLIQRAFTRTVKGIFAGQDVPGTLHQLAQDLERKTAGFRGS